LRTFDTDGELRNMHNSGVVCACKLSLSVG
jgi:hypothetical protein